MTPIKKILPLLTLAALYLGAPAAGRAVPVAIGFPPPGVSAVGSGASGSTAGRTFNYTVSQNPPAGYSDLYWTMEGISGPLSSTFAGGTSQALVFNGFQAGTGYVWNAVAPWQLQTAFGTNFYATRFVLNAFGSASPTTRGSLGLAGNPSEPVFAITGNFSANFSFQAFNGTWVGVDDLFNSLNTVCTGCVNKNTTGQFYGNEVTATPEPMALFLLGSGLVGVAAKLRRRSRPDHTHKA